MGKGFFLVMGTAHGAASQHIKALEGALSVGNDHQRHILGVHIYRVIARHRYCTLLNLRGYVVGAVDGLGTVVEDSAIAVALASRH